MAGNRRQFAIKYLTKRLFFVGLILTIFIANAELKQQGDLAPRSATDGVVNAGDMVIMQQIVTGVIPLSSLTAEELILGDVAPLSGPDGQINSADLLILTREVLGAGLLGMVDVPPGKPTINSVVSPTNDNPYTITGSSVPNANIVIYINGNPQHQAVADGAGVFTVDLYLFDGANVVEATASDSGGVSGLSDSVNIQYDNTINRTLGGNISVDTVWTPGIPAQPYNITGTLTVESGAKLVLQPGTVLQFDSSQQFIINGAIEIRGDSSQPVTLTSSDPGVTTWPGITINSNTTEAIIDYAIIEYASTGIIFDTSGTVGIVSNSIIRNNTTYGLEIRDLSFPLIGDGNVITLNGTGIYLRGTSTTVDKNPNPTISGNKIYNNSTNNVETAVFFDEQSVKIDATENWWGSNDPDVIEAGIFHIGESFRGAAVDYSRFLETENGPPSTLAILIGSLSDTISPLIADTQYRVTASISVNQDDTLTIPQGASLIFSTSKLFTVNGTLLVQGVEGNPVEFTPSQPVKSRGDWRGITLSSTSTGSIIDHAEIGWAEKSIEAIGATNITITNSTIHDYLTYGITFEEEANGLIDTNTIDNIDKSVAPNNSIGIKTLRAGTTSITNNTIINNYIGITVSEPSTISAAAPTIQSNYIAYNKFGIRITGRSVMPLITQNAIVYNEFYGIDIASSSGSDAGNPQPIITDNDIYGNLYDIYISGFGTGSALVLNVTNNWFGIPVPVVGVNIVFSNTPETVIDVSQQAIQPNTGPTVASINVSEPLFSPNGDGNKDLSVFSGTLSEVADWTVAVVKGGVVRKTFPTGTGSTFNIAWDGKDDFSQTVEDGNYTYRVVVTARGMSWNNTPTGQQILDNTAPLSSISNPLDGSLQQSVFNVSVVGSVSDQYFQDYSLEYGEGASPISWTPIVSNSPTPVTATEIYNWIVSSTDGSVVPPNNGLHSFRLTAVDQAGNTTSDTVTFTLDNSQLSLSYLKFFSVGPDNLIFKPERGEVSNLEFYISLPATVTMTITKESDGSLIYTTQQTFTGSGNFSFPWDGKDMGGITVAPDAYLYNFNADDGAFTADYIPDVNNDSAGVAGSGFVDYNLAKNEIWKNEITFTNGSSANNYSSRVSLCVNPNGPAGLFCQNSGTYYILQGVPYGIGTEWFYWEARDPVTGAPIPVETYGFQFLKPTELPSNTVIVRSGEPIISGDGTAPNIEVKSNPYNVRHSYDEYSEIKFRIDQDSTVTVKLLPPGIYDPTDPSAMVLMPATPLSAESAPGVPILHPVTWLGYDDTVPENVNNILVDDEGMYTFTIEATSSINGKTTLYRGALNLYH